MWVQNAYPSLGSSMEDKTTKQFFSRILLISPKHSSPLWALIYQNYKNNHSSSKAAIGNEQIFVFWSSTVGQFATFKYFSVWLLQNRKLSFNEWVEWLDAHARVEPSRRAVDGTSPRTRGWVVMLPAPWLLAASERLLFTWSVENLRWMFKKSTQVMRYC